MRGGIEAGVGVIDLVFVRLHIGDQLFKIVSGKITLRDQRYRHFLR